MAFPAKSEVRPRADSAAAREQLRQRYERGETELFVPLAELARRAGQTPEALALLQTGLKRWPRRVSAWVQLARLQAQSGHMDEALAHYRHVLEVLDPRNLPALRALVASSLATGAIDEARGYLETWAVEDPEDPELADFGEEVEAMAAKAPEPSRAPRATSPRLTELSLDELEPGFLASPSPADGMAWGAAAGQASGTRRGKEPR